MELKLPQLWGAGMRPQKAADLLRTIQALAGALAPSVISGRSSGFDRAGYIKISGLHPFALTRKRLTIGDPSGPGLISEIVEQGRSFARALPLGGSNATELSSDAFIRFPTTVPSIRISDQWIGRVFDALLQPLDGGGAMQCGDTAYPIHASPPVPGQREALGSRIETGVRAINLFATCRKGQRLGIFAGSGVGKSSLLSMLLRHSTYDVAVVALIGERGREVRDFVEGHMGKDRLRKACVVAATSDVSPILQRDAAYIALTLAEFFRDQGRSVLLLFDSITRFCLALRETILNSGQPPASRGYPPTVFSELAKLLERAGPGPTRLGGSMTAFFNVLVEGDDLTEPVADSVRGILDGHIILDRQISEAGRYPPIDVIRSLSRNASEGNSYHENALIRRAREILQTRSAVQELIHLGAYRKGADPQIDLALMVSPLIEELLVQAVDEPSCIVDDFLRLEEIFSSINRSF
ncbi:MAG: FliI/YscN family ATPase [Proteobacteria bacterium]|nr:FliI/YscN family ATPase [Pseudomonadota bacterium]